MNKSLNMHANILKNNSKIKGFTLAEVLIALVVIGIIAAITVPTLIQRYQDQALKSALKKNYSVLKSALDKYQVENGERLLPCDLAGHALKPIFIKYFNILKDCVYHDCYNYNNEDLYKNYNESKMTYVWPFDDGQFILNDGSFLMIENPSGCDVIFSVDVNGMDKKPNRLGKDLFMFQLMSNGDLLPMGVKGTNYYSETDAYCSNTSKHNMNGAGCTAKVLKD
jgi:prepilin-type N-terminal cleavage/methylation domain-containing protein